MTCEVDTIYVDDHSRASTPAEVVSLGADYLVIERAITGAKNSEAVIEEIILSIS